MKIIYITNKLINMKTYLTNIKAIWKIYKDGRFYSKNYNVYTYMLVYTVKYIKCKLTNTN